MNEQKPDLVVTPHLREMPRTPLPDPLVLPDFPEGTGLRYDPPDPSAIDYEALSTS